MGFLLLPKTAERSGILGTEWLGDANCVSVFAPNGPAPFLHRKAGVHELRQRVRPFRAGSFPLNLSGELRSAERGDSPRPAAGQEGRHQGFYPLVNHPFPKHSTAKIGERQLLRKGERQLDYSCMTFVDYCSSQIMYCYTCQSTLRRRDMTVSRDLFTCCYGQHFWVKLEKVGKRVEVYIIR
mgnify:CR=1 FL=1